MTTKDISFKPKQTIKLELWGKTTTQARESSIISQNCNPITNEIISDGTAKCIRQSATVILLFEGCTSCANTGVTSIVH